jgi:hypothetical protein
MALVEDRFHHFCRARVRRLRLSTQAVPPELRATTGGCARTSADDGRTTSIGCSATPRVAALQS